MPWPWPAGPGPGSISAGSPRPPTTTRRALGLARDHSYPAAEAIALLALGLSWFREPTGGGAEQIEVQYSDGSYGYQDLNQWAASSSQGSSETAKLSAAEVAVSTLISQTYTTPVDDSQLSSGEQQQAQQQLQQQDQQLQNSQQQVNSNANSPADTYEYQFLTQLNGKENTVWTSDDCNTSDNYDECDF